MRHWTPSTCANRARHRPAELSGGQRQRVAIARATILRPTALLADEPTGNLDHRIGAEVMALLENLHHAGTTLIVVTHDRELGARAHRHIAMPRWRDRGGTRNDSAARPVHRRHYEQGEAIQKSPYPRKFWIATALRASR